jgi:hypothetical protein
MLAMRRAVSQRQICQPVAIKLIKAPTDPRPAAASGHSQHQIGRSHALRHLTCQREPTTSGISIDTG